MDFLLESWLSYMFALLIAAWSFPVQYAADAKIAADIDHCAEAVEEPVDWNQQQTVFERKIDSGKYESHRNKAC